MKRLILFFAILSILFSISAQTISAQEKLDLIVLIDSSQSMFTYYNDVVDYVLTQTIKDYARQGDVFHLLSFSDNVKEEIKQVLFTEQDLKSVIARLYLLCPLGTSTDMISALEYLYKYVDNIKNDSTKCIVFITDGINSPDKNSPYQNLNSEDTSKHITDTITNIRKNGWIFKIVKIPSDLIQQDNLSELQETNISNNSDNVNKISSDKTSSSSQNNTTLATTTIENGKKAEDYSTLLEEISSDDENSSFTVYDPDNSSSAVNNTVTLPIVSFPNFVSANVYSFNLPMSITNNSNSKMNLSIPELFIKTNNKDNELINILDKKVNITISSNSTEDVLLPVSLPLSIPGGFRKLSLEPRFANGVRVNPGKASIIVWLKISKIADLFKGTFGIFIIAFLALIIAVITLIIIKLTQHKAQKKSDEPIIDAMIDSSSNITKRKNARFSYAQNKNELSQTSVLEKEQQQISESSKTLQTSSNQNDQSINTLLNVQNGQAQNALFNSQNEHTQNAQIEHNKNALINAQNAQSKNILMANYSNKQNQSISTNNSLNRETQVNNSSHIVTITGQESKDNLLLKTQNSKAVTNSSIAKRINILLNAKNENKHSLSNLELKPKTKIQKVKRLPPMNYTTKITKPSSARIVLYVKGQNTNIGKRNIKIMHSGNKKSVGGKNSDFLIFLLPVPRKLGLLVYEGDNATFVPYRSEYFPDYTEAITNCIGKEIRLVTHKGRELFLTFEFYVSPLEKFNKLLDCLEVPKINLILNDDKGAKQKEQK